MTFIRSRAPSSVGSSIILAIHKISRLAPVFARMGIDPQDQPPNQFISMVFAAHIMKILSIRIVFLQEKNCSSSRTHRCVCLSRKRFPHHYPGKTPSPNTGLVFGDSPKRLRAAIRDIVPEWGSTPLGRLVRRHEAPNGVGWGGSLGIYNWFPNEQFLGYYRY